jgi:hypothetical protein
MKNMRYNITAKTKGTPQSGYASNNVKSNRYPWCGGDYFTFIVKRRIIKNAIPSQIMALDKTFFNFSFIVYLPPFRPQTAGIMEMPGIGATAPLYASCLPLSRHFHFTSYICRKCYF